MSLPTPTQILALDFAFNGSPYVIVPAKASVSLGGMDFAEEAHPTGYGATSGGGGGVVARPVVFVST